METATRPTNFIAGENYPSPVTHVIGLDYYDGLISGLLKTAGGSTYTFEMTAEEYNPDGVDRRTFELALLSAGAFDCATELLERYLGPSRPLWVPIWKFPSEEARGTTEEALDRLLASKGSPSWQVTATDITETVSAIALS